MVGAMKTCLPNGWDYVHNIGTGPVARIIVAWDTQGPKVSVLISSDQMLLLSVQMDNRCFALSVVYGFNQAGPRKKLWDELRTGFASVGGLPWIVLGDFNVVRWQNEKSNSSHFDANATGDFNNCIEDIEMAELTSKGLWFTWSNKQVGVGHCSCRLDRALVNSQWQSEFTESEVAVLVPHVSNHSPLLVTVLPYCGGRKPFKFFNFWMNHKKFSPLLTQSWGCSVDKVGSPMFQLYEKLRRLKPCLKKFNKEFYSDIQNRVLVAREELSSIQNCRAQLPGDPILMEYERLCLLNFNDLCVAEEAWCRQKSRVRWLHLGDNNTRFFHKKVASHRMRNKILSICDENGKRLEDMKEVKGEILRVRSPYASSPFPKSPRIV
ncbi:hypothetical protein RHMOL_Rhmol09G0045300 [Rhododendron molle]|uniref:Uncharacterized protein n=1 Tax=Rhododendron molle TaxID=49168 RepID=A0ACC0M9Y9_RHOML|nr:hypothetical protein RHMOL_Rhmol09G0045300 [Rhododendron molle]